MTLQTIKTLIFNLFDEEVQTVQALKKGLTNQNFLVETNSRKLVVRIPYADQSNIVNRIHEAAAINATRALDLDFETLYFDTATGIKITTYVENFESFTETSAIDRIERAASLMQRLHGLKTTIGHNFDPIGRYHQYRQHVLKPMISDDVANVILDRISQQPHDFTLCHNDWVEGNMGFTPERDYLIDYEYAGDNDPMFDVMSFLTENTLTQDEENRFIRAYLNRKPTQKDLEALNAYRDLHNLLWCTWACMMYESRNEPVYFTIAQAKHQALLAKR